LFNLSEKQNVKAENCALLRYDAASSGHLCNNPEERSSQLLRGGSLKSPKTSRRSFPNTPYNIELNVFHPEVLSKVVLGYYM